MMEKPGARKPQIRSPRERNERAVLPGRKAEIAGVFLSIGFANHRALSELADGLHQRLSCGALGLAEQGVPRLPLVDGDGLPGG